MLFHFCRVIGRRPSRRRSSCHDKKATKLYSTPFMSRSLVSCCTAMADHIKKKTTFNSTGFFPGPGPLLVFLSTGSQRRFLQVARVQDPGWRQTSSSSPPACPRPEWISGQKKYSATLTREQLFGFSLGVASDVEKKSDNKWSNEGIRLFLYVSIQHGGRFVPSLDASAFFPPNGFSFQFQGGKRVRRPGEFGEARIAPRGVCRSPGARGEG